MNELTGWVLGQQAQQVRKGEELYFKRINKEAQNRKRKRKRPQPTDVRVNGDAQREVNGQHLIQERRYTVPVRCVTHPSLCCTILSEKHAPSY